jgi:hypothetical protein
MAGHRHLSRAAAPLLPRDTSLFDAVHMIIGKLCEHYAPPHDLPPEMRQLLTKLHEGDGQIKEQAGSATALTT